MLDFLIKIILGVEISRENFRVGGLIAAAIVIIVGYLLIVEGNLFGIVDNLLTISQQPWYSFYLAKFSFLMIFIKITFLALFTTKNNPTGRFAAAFMFQFLGLIGTIIIHMFSNVTENLITDPQMKTIVSILPYTISLMIFLVVRVIYEVEYFDEKEWFSNK